MNAKLLVIDDDYKLAEMLIAYLAARGFVVEHRADAATGLGALREHTYDALILDVMLPDSDGFVVCQQVRQFSNIPILMLTARGDDLDRIVGLEMGADDYLPKPFNPRELVARLRAILRRSQRQNVGADDVLRVGDLEIDPGAQEVRKAGQACELTSRQFALLWVLAERSGRVQSRDQLMEAIGLQHDVFDRSVDVHISRIRNAIEDDPKQPRFIQTIRGSGYVFVVRGKDS